MGEGRESDLARMDNSNGNKLGGGVGRRGKSGEGGNRAGV